MRANWTDPDYDEQSIEWAPTTAAAIEPWSISGYTRYMQADEPLDRVCAAFGLDSFARLQALKSRYDPDNAVHRDQGIRRPLSRVGDGGAQRPASA